MKKILITSTAAVAVLIGLFVVGIVPSLALASNYAISPNVTGYTVVGVAQANIICKNLPDWAAGLMTFCAPSSTVIVPPVTSSVVFSNIAVVDTTGVNGTNGLTISWMTDQPTTTTVWYQSDPSNAAQAIAYSNPSQGLTTAHSLTIAGFTPSAASTFMVGGSDAAGTTDQSTGQSFTSWPVTTMGGSSSFGMIPANPTISVSDVTSTGATVNVNANEPIRATITYSTLGGATSTMYSSSAYEASNPIYLNNLDESASYQGEVTVYGQNGSTVGTYPISWVTPS